MSSIRSVVLIVACACAVSVSVRASAQTQQQTSKDDEDDDDRGPWPHPHFYWSNGLHLKDRFGFDVTLGGDAMNDSAGFANTESIDAVLDTSVEDGVQWRRARAYASGRYGRSIEFLFRYDFAVSNPPNLQDAYIGFKRLPLLHKLPFLRTLRIQAGRFRAPLGIDGSMSSADIPLMETALSTSAFLPSRNTGFLFHGATINLKRTIRWSIGYLQPESDLGDIQSKDNLGISARFATAFQFRNDRLLHVGVDLWRRNVNPSIQLASRPESHIAPEFVDTGEIQATHLDVLVIETALQRGPFVFQAELTGTQLSSEETGDPRFYGFYGQVSYFLTGEARPYRAEYGTFGRPSPRQELRDGRGGKGAYELAFRFSRVDLDDKGVAGGRLNDMSVGFNWYPVNRARVMFNYIFANRSDASPVSILQGRLQVAF